MPHASMICFISVILLFAKVKEFVGIIAEEWVMFFDKKKLQEGMRTVGGSILCRGVPWTNQALWAKSLWELY